MKLGSSLRMLDSVSAKKPSNCCQNCSSAGIEVSELSGSGQEEKTESGGSGHSTEVLESLSITFRDLSVINSLSESQLEGVLAVVLPHSLEVRFVGKTSGHLVGEHQVFLLDDLRGHLTESLVFLAESILTLRGGGIHAEHDGGVLVGVGERVQHAIAFLVGVVSEHVALLLLPGKLWHLIVEVTVALTSPDLLESEPLEGVRLLTV